MNVKQDLQAKLQTICPTATVSVSDKADFQCNSAFALAKAEHQNPNTIATNIANQWNQKYAATATASVAGGFINLHLTPAVLQDTAQFIMKNHRLPLPDVPKRTIFLDYGGANIAKALHIGHLRSPIIGEALKRLHTAFGHKTIAGAYLGDWGLQMGLVLAELHARGLKPEDVTLDMLGEIYPTASQKKDVNPAFYQQAADITAKLQNLEKPYIDIYPIIRKLSVDQIQKNYRQLNCTFDLYDGESTYQPNVSVVAAKLKQAGLLVESNSAQIINVATPTDQKPMPPIVFSKQNGGYLYAASDLAALYTRYQQYHPDQFIYMTDARQSLHFEQVFRAAKMGGLVPADTILSHVAYGTINGKDGKPFKTRAGGTVKLEDILHEVTAATSEFAVGLAAIKFADLVNNVHKDYIFDLQKFISFEGKTGPYILYSIVRSKAICAKVGAFTPDFRQLEKYLTPAIRDILGQIIKLTEAYTVALNTLSLNSIAEALYNLAAAFAVFYNQHNIIGETDPAKKTLLLSITVLTQTALTLGLDTLGIDTVDKM